MFSKACEYALKIMIYLSSVQSEGRLAGLKEVASSIDSPEAFTAKILQQLVRASLLQSLRGPNGGFRVVDRPITMLEVVNAIDGDRIIKGCVLGLDECSSVHPCPAHNNFVVIREQLKGVLDNTQLSELKDGVISGNSFLKV